MKKVKISVIMPVYNGEQYLDESIFSILNQSFHDFEFIIIDDGSTDNTANIISKYKNKDKRIKYLKNNKNMGIIESLNRGLKIAKGKYIARMDSDDISLKDRLKIEYNFLERNEKIFLIGSSFIYVDKNGDILKVHRNNYTSNFIRDNLTKTSLIHHPTVMFRNEGKIFYRKKALFCEDRDLWLRFLTENKKMLVLPDILIRYRIHDKSISIKKRNLQERFIQEVIKWYFERLKNGKDSYDNFNPDDFIKENKNLDNNLYTYEVTKIKLLFLSKGDLLRKELHCFWSKYGLSVWKISLLYYFCSFFPIFFRRIFLNIKRIFKK